MVNILFDVLDFIKKIIDDYKIDAIYSINNKGSILLENVIELEPEILYGINYSTIDKRESIKVLGKNILFFDDTSYSGNTISQVKSNIIRTKGQNIIFGVYIATEEAKKFVEIYSKSIPKIYWYYSSDILEIRNLVIDSIPYKIEFPTILLNYRNIADRTWLRKYLIEKGFSKNEYIDTKLLTELYEGRYLYNLNCNDINLTINFLIKIYFLKKQIVIVLFGDNETNLNDKCINKNLLDYHECGCLDCLLIEFVTTGLMDFIADIITESKNVDNEIFLFNILFDYLKKRHSNETISVVQKSVLEKYRKKGLF